MRGSQMKASAISHISYNMLRLHATAMLRHRFGNHVLQRLEAQQRCARVKFKQCLRLTVTDTPNERGSKPLSSFFDGKEFAYGSFRNPRFSLRRSLFLTNTYGAYGGNVESRK